MKLPFLFLNEGRERLPSFLSFSLRIILPSFSEFSQRHSTYAEFGCDGGGVKRDNSLNIPPPTCTAQPLPSPLSMSNETFQIYETYTCTCHVYIMTLWPWLCLKYIIPQPMYEYTLKGTCTVFVAESTLGIMDLLMHLLALSPGADVACVWNMYYSALPSLSLSLSSSMSSYLAYYWIGQSKHD